MFSRPRSQRGKNLFGRPKKEGGSKRQHIRAWVISKQKNEQRSPGVITSVDSSPTLQASIPSSGYDMPDEVRPGKITPKNQRSSPMPSKKDGDVTPEEEMIEEAVPIGHKTFPVPEPPPTVVEHNGLNHDYTDGSEKKLMNDVDDDSCLIKCVYFSQQCCECTIV